MFPNVNALFDVDHEKEYQLFLEEEKRQANKPTEESKTDQKKQ